MKYPMAVHYITAVINKSKADKIWTIRFVLSIRVTDKCKFICLKFKRFFNLIGFVYFFVIKQALILFHSKFHVTIPLDYKEHTINTKIIMYQKLHHYLFLAPTRSSGNANVCLFVCVFGSNLS